MVNKDDNVNSFYEEYQLEDEDGAYTLVVDKRAMSVIRSCVSKAGNHFFKKTILNRSPMIPVALILDNNSEKKLDFIRCRYFNRLRKEEGMINISALAAGAPSSFKDEVRELAEQGLNLSALEWSKTFPVLQDLIELMSDNNGIETIEGTGVAGWNNDRTQFIVPGDKNFCGSCPVVYSSAGKDIEKEKEMLREALQLGFGAHLAICATAGSFLRGIVNTSVSHILHFYGTGGAGKTLAMEIAAAIIGKPADKHAINSWASTPVYCEKLFTGSNHGTAFMDEIDSMYTKCFSDEKYYERLVDIGNCGGRGKSSKNGGVIKSDRWNCTIISTGNKAVEIERSNPRYSAVLGRVIQFSHHDEPLWTTKDKKWSDKIKFLRHNNFGKMRKLITDYVTSHKDELVEVYYKQHDEAPTGDTSIRRFEFWALLKVGEVIIKDLLNIKELPHASKVDSFISKDLEEEELREENDEENVKTEIMNFVFSSLNRFGAKDFWWHRDSRNTGANIKILQKERAPQIKTEEARRQGALLGIIQPKRIFKHEEDLGSFTVYFSDAGVAEAKKRGLDIVQCVEVAKTGGWLVHNKGRNKIKLRFGGGITTYFAFKISESFEGTEEDALNELDILMNDESVPIEKQDIEELMGGYVPF